MLLHHEGMLVETGLGIIGGIVMAIHALQHWTRELWKYLRPGKTPKT
jgi:hypothetical protein